MSSSIYNLALQERDLFMTKHTKNIIRNLTSNDLVQVYDENKFQKIKYGKFVIITASKDSFNKNK